MFAISRLMFHWHASGLQQPTLWYRAQLGSWKQLPHALGSRMTGGSCAVSARAVATRFL